MCFAFISKLPNGAADLKKIKNTPAIFGAVFEFLKGVLSIAPSAYQPLIDWAPTLLAILEEAGVGIWNDHQALEVARTKMGSVIEGADKLQAAREKWSLGPMVCSFLFYSICKMLMCGRSYPMHVPPARSAGLLTTYPSGRKRRRKTASSDHSGPNGCRGWGTPAAMTSTLKTAGHRSAEGGRVGEEAGGLGLGLGRGFGVIAEGVEYRGKSGGVLAGPMYVF